MVARALLPEMTNIFWRNSTPVLINYDHYCLIGVYMLIATYHYGCGTVITITKEHGRLVFKDQDGLDPYCPNIGSGQRVDYGDLNGNSLDVPSYEGIGLFFGLDMTECGW